MLAVIATIRSAPGRRDNLIAALRADIVPHVAGESGTLAYLVHEDLRDPDLIHVYELYDSKEAFIQHAKAVGPMLNALSDLIDGVPELQQAIPVASIGPLG